MKRLATYYYFLLLTIVGISSCKPVSIKDIKIYLNTMSDSNYGLVREKTVGNIHYKVKYLPPDYLTYTTVKNEIASNSNLRDSIQHQFNQSMTFLLNISPSDKKVDFSSMGAKNYSEFSERLEKIAFTARDWIVMSCGDAEYKPTIVQLESLNPIENSRNLLVVFNTPQNNLNKVNHDYTLIYSDDLFNTGINKFTFKSDDIESFPLLDF